MTDLLSFNFKHDDESKNRTYQFKKDKKIKEILLFYLSNTNSIMTLDVDKIMFLNKSKILNSPNYLDKTIAETFKYNKQNTQIQIKDSGNVVGG